MREGEESKINFRILNEEIRKALKGSDVDFAVAYLFLYNLNQNQLLPNEYINNLKKYYPRYQKILRSNPRIRNILGRIRFDYSNTQNLVDSYRANVVAIRRSDIIDPDEEANYQRSKEQEELAKQYAAMDELEERRRKAVEESIQRVRYNAKLKNSPPKQFHSPLKFLPKEQNNVGQNWFQQQQSALADIARQGINTIQDIGEGAKHIGKGAITGAMFAVPAMVVNPAIALPAMAIGTALGASKSMSDSARGKINLRTFDANTVFDNQRSLSPWTKHMIRLALINNPTNWGIKLEDISNPAVRKFLEDEGLINRMGENNYIDPERIWKNYQFVRQTDNIIQELPITGGALVLTSLITGNPLAAAAVGATVGGYRLAQRLKLQEENRKDADEQVRLNRKTEISFVQNKGSIGGGSSRVNREQEMAIRQASKELPGVLQGVIAISKNVESKLGLPDFTKTIEKTIIKWNRLPTLLKYAPVLAPIIYILGGPILGYAAAASGILTAFGLGLGSTAIGVLSENDDKLFNKKFNKEKGASDITLEGAKIANKLDEFLGFLTPGFEAIGKLLGYVGVFFFVKSLWDLFNHGIKKFSDYAKVGGLVVSFLLSYSVIKEIFNDMTLNTPKPLSEKAAEAYYKSNTNNFEIATSSVFNCFESPNLPDGMNLIITDVIELEKGDGYYVNIKGKDESTEYLFKNIQNPNTKFKIGEEINSNSISCS